MPAQNVPGFHLPVTALKNITASPQNAASHKSNAAKRAWRKTRSFTSISTSLRAQ